MTRKHVLHVAICPWAVRKYLRLSLNFTLAQAQSSNRSKLGLINSTNNFEKKKQKKILVTVSDLSLVAFDCVAYVVVFVSNKRSLLPRELVK